MLILTRRVGEILRIEDEIKLVVIDIDTFHVKLGVEAPKNVSVHREEVYRRIRNGQPINFAVR